MPQEIEIDGEVKQYYTPEEFEETQNKLKELEESANPNWAEARTKMRLQEQEIARLSKFRESGKDIDDEGNVVEKPSQLTIEQIRNEAAMATRSELLNERKSELLSQFDDEKRSVVETYFNKLSHGEELNIKNITDFVQQAAVLAEPNRRGTVAVGAGGDAPRPSFNQKNDFADSDEGKSLAANMGLNV